MLPGLMAAMLAAGFPRGVDGQETGTYRLAPGDTLRYSQSIRRSIFTSLPQGDVPSSFVREAELSIVAADPGTWRAWYDDLEVRSVRMAGVVEPTSPFIMGRPFVLEVEPRGEFHLTEAPTLWMDWLEMFDPTTQFVDFFVSLPGGAPKVGDEWSDTVTSSPDLSASTELQAVRRMRVEGDTIFEGRPALVIAVSVESTLRSDLPVPGWSGGASTTLTGSDTGLVIYDPDLGVMLHREREGSMQGVVATGDREIPQRVSHRSTIRLIR